LAEAAPNPNTLIGEIVGGYVLESVVAVGGMGAVYRGRHTDLDREAAVKVLAPQLAKDEEYVNRFLSEAKIVDEIQHPNVVNLFDFVRNDDPPFVAYTMELLHGPSLRQVALRKPLDVLQAVYAADQIASALEATHALGVIHRDLKPENVVVVGDLEGDLSEVPSVKVLDFGIAKRATVPAGYQTGPFALGTPHYMAPEQICAGEVGPATDVYALGELMFEIMIGRSLFDGDLASILAAKLGKERPEELARVEHYALRSLISDCIQHDMTLRPSIAEFRERLHEVIAVPTALMAPATSVIDEMPDSDITRRAILGFALGAACFLGAAAVITVVRKKEPPPPPKRIAPAKPKVAPAVAPAAVPDPVDVAPLPAAIEPVEEEPKAKKRKNKKRRGKRRRRRKPRAIVDSPPDAARRVPEVIESDTRKKPLRPKRSMDVDPDKPLTDKEMPSW